MALPRLVVPSKNSTLAMFAPVAAVAVALRVTSRPTKAVAGVVRVPVGAIGVATVTLTAVLVPLRLLLSVTLAVRLLSPNAVVAVVV